MFSRGLACASTCENQLGGMGVDSVLRCAEKKIHYGTGFEQAINAWLIACAGDELLSQPPFDTINPNVINQFRSRCKRHGFDILLASLTQWSSGYATMPTLTHILTRTKVMLEKRNGKRSIRDMNNLAAILL